LPPGADDLETDFTEQNYTDVSADDGVRVDQAATGEYNIFQFKDYVANNSCSLVWNGQCSLAPSESAVMLQIYSFNLGEWWTANSNTTANADTDFNLSADIADLSDYKDANNIIVCRVYQLG